MKSYIYALIVLITLGLILAGCSQQETGKSSTTQNKTPAQETKTSPQKAQTDSKESSSDSVKAVTVYKSPTCGCCTMWESHMTKAGFQVTSKPVENMGEIRKQYKVPEKMQSCHTAIIDGYVIEGHVPADDVKRLLKERAAVVGLAAPGMPANSPGMQPEGEKPSGYDVLSFDREGNSKVFTSYK